MPSNRERPTRSRSWREAKRVEDNAPRVTVEHDVAPQLAPQPVEGSQDMLRDTQDLLGLSDPELAPLFGVDAAAMEEWRRHGVPPRHAERLEELHEAARRLASHGRERSVAELARLPVPEVGARCILDLLADPAVEPAVVEQAIAALQARASSRPLRPRTSDAIVADLMEPQVATVDAEDPVREAARRMRASDVGDVVVIERGRPAAILTDRDIVIRVVAEQRDPAITKCASVATRGLEIVGPRTPVAEAVALMRRRALRRLPVVEDGDLLGVISLADVAVDREPHSVVAAVAAAEAND